MTNLSSFSLEGCQVIVTGANTGIGQGIAVAAARAGARIIGVGRSAMDDTAAMIAAIGEGKFAAVHTDLADPTAVRDLIPELWRQHGAIDGVVNNAGIIRRDAAIDYSESDWDDVMDVNLKSLFLLSQSFAKLALANERRAKIVNVASLLSFQGGINVVAYAASKHGVVGLTKALCNEWAGAGVNVNAIAPGYIVSNNTAPLRADRERTASIIGRIPAGRWGVPSDIGSAACFLLSRASDYIHGATIPVDGGWLAR